MMFSGGEDPYESYGGGNRGEIDAIILERSPDRESGACHAAAAKKKSQQQKHAKKVVVVDEETKRKGSMWGKILIIVLVLLGLYMLYMWMKNSKYGSSTAPAAGRNSRAGAMGTSYGNKNMGYGGYRNKTPATDAPANGTNANADCPGGFCGPSSMAPGSGLNSNSYSYDASVPAAGEASSQSAPAMMTPSRYVPQPAMRFSDQGEALKQGARGRRQDSSDLYSSQPATGGAGNMHLTKHGQAMSRNSDALPADVEPSGAQPVEYRNSTTY